MRAVLRRFVGSLWGQTKRGETTLGILERLPFWESWVASPMLALITGLTAYMWEAPGWAAVIIFGLALLSLLLGLNWREQALRNKTPNTSPILGPDGRGRSAVLKRPVVSFWSIALFVDVAILATLAYGLPRSAWTNAEPDVQVTVSASLWKGSDFKTDILMVALTNNSGKTHRDIGANIHTSRIKKVSCEGPEERVEIIGGGADSWHVALNMEEMSPYEMKVCTILLHEPMSQGDPHGWGSRQQDGSFWFGSSTYWFDDEEPAEVIFIPLIVEEIPR